MRRERRLLKQQTELRLAVPQLLALRRHEAVDRAAHPHHARAVRAQRDAADLLADGAELQEAWVGGNTVVTRLRQRIVIGRIKKCACLCPGRVLGHWGRVL